MMQREREREREHRLSRMRDYARSRSEAEDGVYIAHGSTARPSGCKQPFTDRVVFCSATEASVIDFISK